MRSLPIAAMALMALSGPALGESQSSNSSSNCSDGRCSRIESHRVEDRWGSRGFVREERWREGRGPGDAGRRGPPPGWDAPPGWHPGQGPRRRGRDDD